MKSIDEREFRHHVTKYVFMAKDGETMARLSEVQEFNDFRTALKASGPVSPPQATQLETVGAGFEM